ncbi:hypothetical protein HYW21_02100 [Candidatus Woesearchaeota archaeon]|nr:hypothetical protein [Candidatus Woesearchaeota archaeon]
MEWRVLANDGMHERGVEKLTEAGFKVDTEHRDLDGLVAAIGDYDALIVRSATSLKGDEGMRVFAAGADRLKVVVRGGTGVDSIDLNAAAHYGVGVLNTPAANTTSVAELVFGMMLAYARHIPEADAATQAGEWKKSRLEGTELRGKTLGIIGCGNIGREVAHLGLAFHMTVVGYDPLRPSGTSIHYVDSIEEVLRGADYVTIHTPAQRDGRPLIDSEQLGYMKRTAVLINTARGSLINEETVATAVREGRLGGVCCDVYHQEKKGTQLFTSPLIGIGQRGVLTPHLGASTVEAQERVALEAAGYIIECLSLDPPQVDGNIYARFANAQNRSRALPVDVVFIHQYDRPGVNGEVGTVLGNYDININTNTVVPLREGTALAVYRTDHPVTSMARDQLRTLDGVLRVKNNPLHV